MEDGQKLTTKEIQAIVGKNRVLARHECVCENVSHIIPYREIDVMSIKSGLVYEYEVKISRGDFIADKKKKKHKFTGHGDKNVLIPSFNPNYFYYVCPEGMISENEIPQYAGLYYIIDGELCRVRKANLYNTHKHDLIKIQEKLLRLHQERYFLGGALMTYKNRLSAEANERIRKQYPNPLLDNPLIDEV